MEKVLQELFCEHFFWVPRTFKRYQNTSECGTTWCGFRGQGPFFLLLFNVFKANKPLTVALTNCLHGLRSYICS